MLNFPRLLSLLIKIDQETVLKWFGLEDNSNLYAYQTNDYGYDLNVSNFETSTDISVETFRLIIEGLWEKIQDGLTLADIENILFFVLFVRFIILAFRYNLKTSFYITCIGLFAGYLWYRHLIDLISMYRNVLLKLPFLNKLGMDAVQLRSMHRQMVLTDLKLGEDAHWYDPGQVLYYAFTKGVIHTDPETGFRYYIDPISMAISNLQDSAKSNVLPIYYKIYNKIIPKIYDICSKFWNQLSGVAAYAVITRIGKRYCPYLIRWHWTFLLIIGMIEQIFVYFIYRVYYFQTFIILPQTKMYENYTDPNLLIQMNLLNAVIASVVLAHIGFIIFALFHAILGQYFYLPFFVENTELHIGPRPKNSIYSGGQTAWQEPKEKEKSLNRLLPKLWYGWFGRGTGNGLKLNFNLRKLLKKIFKR
jgi:hypothetical protein|uniref:Uncharacterized protein n=1 Tax=Halamphora coffeiformis TaxID=1487565 RepID=A0A516ZBK9_9STRA|nr:hypothetical protein [Halamphora coffeaeformis]QDR25093.1 hypothetical protein [Halamphora coffeaeformis]